MKCRGCGSLDVELVVDLGLVPDADLFPEADEPLPDPAKPLQMHLCRRCHLAQLGDVAVADEQPVLAVESGTSRRHAADSVAAVLAAHPELLGRPVAEFASHHGGSWLPALEAAGCRRVGTGEPAALVVDVHGLAHEPDLAASLQERAARLAADGLLVLEFHHLLPLVERTQFDTIRHGHWSYLSAVAVAELARPLGLELVDAVATDAFGGSLRLTLAHTGSAGMRPAVAAVIGAEEHAGLTGAAAFREFSDRALAGAGRFHDALDRLARHSVSVAGYGAPSKATVLLTVAGVGPELLPFTVDRAQGKHDRRIPGAAVPIRPVDELVAARPEAVVVLTWDIAAEVVADLESAGGWGARYLLPPDVMAGKG